METTEVVLDEMLSIISKGGFSCMRVMVEAMKRERLIEAWSEADSAYENMFASTIMRRWGHLF